MQLVLCVVMMLAIHLSPFFFVYFRRDITNLSMIPPAVSLVHI